MKTIIKTIELELNKAINGLSGNYSKEEVTLTGSLVKTFADALKLHREIEYYKKLEPIRDKVFTLFNSRVDKLLTTLNNKADEQVYISLANEITNLYNLLEGTDKFYASVKEIRYNNTQEDGDIVMDGLVGSSIMDCLRKLQPDE